MLRKLCLGCTLIQLVALVPLGIGYEGDSKVGRAKNDMLTIKKAYETYYIQHKSWPNDQAEVIPLLEQGQNAFESPWPKTYYEVRIEKGANPAEDQVTVTCQPPGKPTIILPDVQPKPRWGF